MNPTKEILDQFESIKHKFEKNSNEKNGKLNIKNLTSKEYELKQNQLMNFINDLIMNSDNITFIIKSNLDLKTWNLLTDRISKILKYKIEPSHLGKNFQLILQNTYSVLIQDLKNNFEFFRNMYSIIENYDVEGKNILISNILNFMGDLKKLKLILNKKFDEYKEIINIEGDNKKDANLALRFFNFALQNNPYNTRIYSNLGYVYREFLNDNQNSAYWFIRAVSCVDNDLKKVKDNLEKNFNSIRKSFLKKEYFVNNDVSFLKYDLEYFPLLFYRIMGILYMNIDVDKLENLIDYSKIILEKMLQNYSMVQDNYKFSYEINGFVEQLVILIIFNFHNSLNGLVDYPTASEKIIIDKNFSPLLNIPIYNHNLLKDLQNTTIKTSLKFTISLLSIFLKIVCQNINEETIVFSEKFLLMIFYWFSLNYDAFELLVDEEIKASLKYLNFVLKNSLDIKNLNPQVIEKINKMITPIETTFFGFIPLNRFFVLNPKQGLYKVEDIKELSIINKLTLCHFLDSFNLKAENNQELALKFSKRHNLNITEKIVTENVKFILIFI